MYKTLLTITIILFCLSGNSQVLGNSQAGHYQNDASANANFIGEIPISIPTSPQVSNMQHLTIRVNGLYNARAKGFLAIFNLVQTGKSTAETDSLYQARFEAFRYSLFKLGVEEKDIYTDFISFLPIYEVEKTKKLFSTKYEEIPKGFEMQKNIHIKMNDPKQLDPIISAAAAQGIYDLVKVEYFVEDQEKILDQLRKGVQSLLEEKEEEFRNVDIDLNGKWRMIGDNWNVKYPMQQYRSYTAKTRYTLDDMKDGATINEVRVPKTQFYNKMDYNAFDVVINPEFVDPVVQFTYGLVMEYEVLKPVKEPKPIPPAPVTKEIKKFILIMPDGQTKELIM